MAIPQAKAVIISRVNTIKTPDLTEDCVDLINHRIAHAVISDLGTTAETATALTSYNNFKATLS